MGDVNYRILLVEDCKKGMSKIYTDFIFSEYKNLHINLVTSIADAEHRLQIEDFSAVLLAPNLPHYDGTSLVSYIKKIVGEIPLIVSLNSDNAERAEDVKKISVAKIYLEDNIDIAEVEKVCSGYESKRESSIPKAETQQIKMPANSEKPQKEVQNVANGNALQEEIQRHRDALAKARLESENSKEAVSKAKEEAQMLKSEVDAAKKEAEQVKIKVAELTQKNTEQLKEIENSKAKVVSAIAPDEDSDVQLDAGLERIIEEKSHLSELLQNLQGDVAQKDSALLQLHEDVTGLRSEIEDLNNNKQELKTCLTESENKKNIYLKDAQNAIDNSKRAEEQARVAAERAGECERLMREANQQRDNALESARVADEGAARAEQEKGAALGREEAALEAQRKAEGYSVELSKKLEESVSMTENLTQVVETLEVRCEELEAGQAALIEAEHVGLQRERGAKELAEGELREVKTALGELEKIERERSKLEELLKDGQQRESELIEEKTKELEEVIASQQEGKRALEDKIAALKSECESQNNTIDKLTAKTESYEKELAQKDELVVAFKTRVGEYKNTINELGVQREKREKEYLEARSTLEAKISELGDNQERIQCVEDELVSAKEEFEALVNDKNAVMESYANKTEAVQARLSDSEKMLKECEWKLEREVSLKELALERVMELGAFEEQVGTLGVELESKNVDLQSLKNVVASQKEEIVRLSKNEEELKDRVQLEALSKEMKIDSLQADIERVKNDYRLLESKAKEDKNIVTHNAEETQRVLAETSEKLKTTQWEAKDLLEKNGKLEERIGELEGEVDLLGDLHEEIAGLKDALHKAEKKILILNDENEKMRGKITDLKAMAELISMLEEKAELADKVAEDVDVLSKALKEEQIEHKKLNVELRKAEERESHLEELKESNKELGWELMKARTLIGEYMAKEQERVIVGGGFDKTEVSRLKDELRAKEKKLNRIIKEKEEFTKTQLIKVAELTELYEKAQTERLELLDRLGR